MLKIFSILLLFWFDIGVNDCYKSNNLEVKDQPLNFTNMTSSEMIVESVSTGRSPDIIVDNVNALVNLCFFFEHFVNIYNCYFFCLRLMWVVLMTNGMETMKIH